MRVIHLNTEHGAGGAARSAYRLHEGLQILGLDSLFLTRKDIYGNLSTGSARQGLRRAIATGMSLVDRLPLRWYLRRVKQVWSVGWLQNRTPRTVLLQSPDIVHLHWTGAGFLSVRGLVGLSRPLVWTLHDSWAFTGGCHLPKDCARYRESCGRCPGLGSHRDKDLSQWVWTQKDRHWRGLPLTVVSPTAWMAQRAAASSLFRHRRIEIIPNGIDTKLYRPLDKRLARKTLKLPLDKKLVLIGAVRLTTDANKGFDLVRMCVERLAHMPGASRVEILIFGIHDLPDRDRLSLPTRCFGVLSDDSELALLYSAADVFVISSREENLPNTIMEALACGTPCVAFGVGGVPEMIEHKRTGYLAKPFLVEDLASGIAWTLENEERGRELSLRSRAKAEADYSLEEIARRHILLYEEIVKSAGDVSHIS